VKLAEVCLVAAQGIAEHFHARFALLLDEAQLLRAKLLHVLAYQPFARLVNLLALLVLNRAGDQVFYYGICQAVFLEDELEQVNEGFFRVVLQVFEADDVRKHSLRRLRPVVVEPLPHGGFLLQEVGPELLHFGRRELLGGDALRVRTGSDHVEQTC